jgi:hypothetical protein
MQRDTAAVFGACFLGSLLAGPLSALLSLLVGTTLPVAGFVALLGTPLALSVGLVIGFPVLLLLTRLGLNRPLLAGVLGASLGGATAVWLAYPHALQYATLAALAAVGALCGLVANRVCALTTSSSGRPSAAAHVER